LHIHKNPIVEIPVSLNKLWPEIEEFSLDWFSYILPFIGRIINKKQSEKDQDEKPSEIKQKRNSLFH